MVLNWIFVITDAVVIAWRLLITCRFRALGDKHWQTIRVMPTNATSVTLYDLQPDTVYQFSILARDQNGTARYSSLASATTRGRSLALFALRELNTGRP